MPAHPTSEFTLEDEEGAFLAVPAAGLEVHEDHSTGHEVGGDSDETEDLTRELDRVIERQS